MNRTCAACRARVAAALAEIIQHPLDARSMQPEQALAAARTGTLHSVYLVLGEERYSSSRFLHSLKELVLEGSVPGLNEDEWNAAEVEPQAVVGAAKTLPMLARRRWVQVSELERWETRKDGAFGAIEEYAKAPSPSTTLVLVASKLNAKRKLITLAKAGGFLVSCDPLDKRALPAWLAQAAQRRGCSLDPMASDLILEVADNDLSLLDDLIERLCLFLGGKGAITEQTVSELIPVVRPSSVWELAEAVAQRNIGRALESLGKVYDPQDRGLRLVGILLWSTRQMLLYEAARAAGDGPAQAAKAAGVPPYRATKLEAQLRQTRRAALERWICVLRDVDLALKGGSKRPPRSVLEAALLDLCSQSAPEPLQRRPP